MGARPGRAGARGHVLVGLALLLAVVAFVAAVRAGGTPRPAPGSDPVPDPAPGAAALQDAEPWPAATPWPASPPGRVGVVLHAAPAGAAGALDAPDTPAELERLAAAGFDAVLLPVHVVVSTAEDGPPLSALEGDAAVVRTVESLRRAGLAVALAAEPLTRDSGPAVCDRVLGRPGDWADAAARHARGVEHVAALARAGGAQAVCVTRDAAPFVLPIRTAEVAAARLTGWRDILAVARASGLPVLAIGRTGAVLEVGAGDAAVDLGGVDLRLATPAASTASALDLEALGARLTAGAARARRAAGGEVVFVGAWRLGDAARAADLSELDETWVAARLAR